LLGTLTSSKPRNITALLMTNASSTIARFLNQTCFQWALTVYPYDPTNRIGKWPSNKKKLEIHNITTANQHI
jgi:hypothetical protein